MKTTHLKSAFCSFMHLLEANNTFKIKQKVRKCVKYYLLYGRSYALSRCGLNYFSFATEHFFSLKPSGIKLTISFDDAGIDMGCRNRSNV